jgi:LacI family transcriptional regulator
MTRVRAMIRRVARSRGSTIVDVAKLANVTPSVVSRVLNEDPTLRIKAETRTRIERAVEMLGYQPNHAGRALRRSRSDVVGVLLPDITNPIYSGILVGIEQCARDSDYVVMLGNADEFSRRPQTYNRLLGGGRLDGMLIQRPNDLDDTRLSRLLDPGMPTVLLNTTLPGTPGSVIFDDWRAAAAATEHLIALGHTSIAHLAGPPAVDSARRRREGFEQAMEAAGLPIGPSAIVHAGYGSDGGREALRDLLRAAPEVTAVVVASVVAAIGALGAAREAGVRVPEELSIVALHDVWMASYTAPPLTTVRMPLRELGETAMRMLLERIADAPPRDEVIRHPAPQVVERGSAAPPRAR